MELEVSSDYPKEKSNVVIILYVLDNVHKNLIGKISGHVDNKGTDYDESYAGKYESAILY